MFLYKVTAHQLDDSVTYCIYCNFGAEFVVNNYQNGFMSFSVCMLKTGINCKTSTSSQTKFKCMY